MGIVLASLLLALNSMYLVDEPKPVHKKPDAVTFPI